MDETFYFSTGGCANGTPAGMGHTPSAKALGKRKVVATDELETMDYDWPDPPKLHSDREYKAARHSPVLEPHPAPDQHLQASLELARRLQAEEDALNARARTQAFVSRRLWGDSNEQLESDLAEALEGMEQEDTGLFNPSLRDFENEHYQPEHGYWTATELGPSTGRTPLTEQVMEFHCSEAMDEGVECVEVAQPCRVDVAAALATMSADEGPAWPPLKPVASASHVEYVD